MVKHFVRPGPMGCTRKRARESSRLSGKNQLGGITASTSLPARAPHETGKPPARAVGPEILLLRFGYMPTFSSARQ